MTVPPLHLLPGLHGTAALFGPFRDALDAPSSVTEYEPDLEPTAASILEQIRVTVPRNERYLLLAESFSGPFAARFAAEKPDGLVGVVFACTFLRVPHPAVLRALPPVRWKPPWWLSRRIVANGIGQGDVLQMALDVERSLDPILMRARLRLLGRTDSRDAARVIDVPALALHGRGDRLVTFRHARRTASIVPRCTLRPLSGPHLLLQAQAREAAKAIVDWMPSAL